MEFSPYAYEFHEDPYPIYKRLREEAPVYYNPKEDFWALSRHRDVLAGFKDTDRFSNSHGVSVDPSAAGPAARVGTSFLGMDPPEHTTFRSLISKTFTPRRVSALEPRIRELTVEHLDRLVGAGDCDAINDFAGLLPMDVISEMFAVPREDRAELRRHSDTLVHREQGENDLPPTAGIAFGEIRQYFQDHVKKLRANPGEDLLSSMIAMIPEHDILNEEELLSFCNLLIVAGNETTTKLLGNALYWLSLNPGQRQKVHEDSKRIPDWVEETLRYDNSTQLLMRLLLEDVKIDEITIPARSRVVLLVGAANRDPEVFDRPDEYDLDRDKTASLAFGRGAHFCLGASLARMEGVVALEEWIKRFPDYAVEASGIERVHSVNVRGFAKLPIRLA